MILQRSCNDDIYAAIDVIKMMTCDNTTMKKKQQVIIMVLTQRKKSQCVLKISHLLKKEYAMAVV